MDKFKPFYDGNHAAREMEEHRKVEEKMMSPGTRKLIDRLQRSQDGASDAVEAKWQEFDAKNDYLLRHGDVSVAGIEVDGASVQPLSRSRHPDSPWALDTLEDDNETAKPPPPLELFPPCTKCRELSCICEPVLTKEDINLPNAIYASGVLSTIGVGCYALIKATNPEFF